MLKLGFHILGLALLFHAVPLRAQSFHLEFEETTNKTLKLQKEFGFAESYEKAIVNSFACPNFHENIWSSVRALMREPETESKVEKIVGSLEKALSEHFLTSKVDLAQEHRELAINEALKIFKALSGEAKNTLRKPQYASSGAFAEALYKNAVELSYPQREFRRELHRSILTLSRLSILARRDNCEQKTLPQTLRIQSEQNNTKIDVSQITIRRPREYVNLNFILPKKEDSKLSVKEPKKEEAPSLAAVENTHREKATEKLPEKLPEKTPPPKEATGPLRVADIDGEKDFLDSIYQDKSCRDNLGRNMRRLAFLFFSRAAKQHVDAGIPLTEGQMKLFARRAAMTIKESAGGLSTRVYSHSKDSKTYQHHSTPDFAGDYSTKALAYKLKTKASSVAQFSKANPAAFAAAEAKRFRGVLDSDKKYWIDKAGLKRKIREGHGVVSNLKLYRNAQNGEANYDIKWNDQLNFGIVQMSADRLVLPRFAAEKWSDYKLAPELSAKQVLVGEENNGHLQWLTNLIAKKDFKSVMAYCRTHDFFTDPISELNKEFTKLSSSCPAGKLKVESYEQLNKERIGCFGSWMMLCPGLNYNTSLYTPDDYFGTTGEIKRKEKYEWGGPLCLSSFKDILEKHKKAAAK